MRGRSDVMFLRASGLRVQNGSSKVTVGRFQTGNVQLDHASGTVLTGDDLGSVLAADSPGTILVNDDVKTDCHDGVVLSGASSGATIENTVVDTNAMSYPPKPCGADTNHTGLRVYPSATTGTKA